MRNIKPISLSLSFFSLLSLSGCNNPTQPTVDYKMLAPKGAPTLAIYQDIIDGKVSTTAETTSIPVELMKKDSIYDFIVFDSIAALNLIGQEKSEYTYLKSLTSGNFHLAGFNKTKEDTIKNDDLVVSFAKGGITDQVLKYLHPDFSNIQYKQSVSEVAPILKTGKYEGQDKPIDWAFIAQPALNNVMKVNNSDDNPNNDIIDMEVAVDALKEKTNGTIDFIPQAGLFVKNSFYEINKTFVDKTLLPSIDTQLNSVIDDIDGVAKKLNSLTLETKSKFGFEFSVFDDFKNDTYKQFGITNPSKTIDEAKINEFKELIKPSK